MSLIVLLLPLCWQLRRDYLKGLGYAVFLCVSMSTFQRIPLPGDLPQLTIFRLVLIILFFAWLKQRRMGRVSSGHPCSGWFWFWALANLVSLLLTSVDFVNSLKRYLDFVLEVWGFYFIVTTSLHSREEAMRILRAAVAGITLVAALAFVEKYTAFNPVNLIITADEQTEGGLRDVVATYQHRILLGAGMAMGFPLAFVLARQAAEIRQKIFLWSATLLLVASCYFSQSRGPWIGVGLAGAVLIVLGTRKVRRGLFLIVGLATILLVARPGVYTTLFNSAKVTAEADSFKGGTFLYRLELWKVAWSQVSKSPIRFLFGYGPGCGVDNEIDWHLSYRNNEEWGISSWDNHYAYDMFQSGVVGLLARLALYLAVARGIFRLYKQSEGQERETLVAVFASAAVLIFMMSNVLIFSKQLNFLFWALAAIGFAFRLPERELPRVSSDQESNVFAPQPVA